jgi:hypothetical protein
MVKEVSFPSFAPIKSFLSCNVILKILREKIILLFRRNLLPLGN